MAKETTPRKDPTSPPTPGASVPAKREQTKLDVIKSLLNGDKFRSELSACLPKHLTAERQARVLTNCLMRNPKLAECTQVSLFSCMLDCSAMGLEPDGRRAHLIPYGNTCTLIVDYKGLIELIYRSEKVDFIDAYPVYDAEVKYDENLKRPRFTIQFGSSPDVKHDPILTGDRGNIIGVYAVAHIRGINKPKFAWMTTDEIEAIRKRSRAANSGPWVTDWVEMAKKTAIRRISKTLPLSYEVAELIEKDIQHEYGSQDFEGRFKAAKPVLGAVETLADAPAAVAGESAGAGAQAPVEAEMAAEDDAAKLLRLGESVGASEAQIVKYAVTKFRLSPVEAMSELAEIAPKRVAQLIAEWDAHKDGVKAQAV